MLHEVGLVHVLDRADVFRQRACERGEPHWPPVELHGQNLQDAVVHRVEPERVDFEEFKGLSCDIFGDHAVAAHLRPIAHALEQAVRQTRCAAAATRDFERALFVDRNVENRRRSVHDVGQLFGRVVLQAERHAEAIAQRPREQTRARGGADEREMGQVEPDRTRGRPLADHDVEHEILERGVQHFLDHAVHAVDLVDEQHVAFLEVREDGGEVARPFYGGPARRLDVGAELVGDNGGQRGLAEPGRAGEQDVVSRLAARLGGLDHDGERFLHLRLTQVVAQKLRPQAAVDREVFLLQFGRHRAFMRRHAVQRIACVEHDAFDFNFWWHRQPLRTQLLQGIL